ncbi:MULTISPECIES: TRAP transporter small permease [unclassified Enterococcus]|jgi:TRAP-type C4-dicarboxylate transport system permease small subunit|uniref:TRAP transporter small permease n=1 Tax=unclassified Enterococcus TaxID=2608891 RepID=UPI00035453B7|nr:TRAP transporter, DctQ-like membrane protein [Enterococcus faecalis 13-SD-W-01]
MKHFLNKTLELLAAALLVIMVLVVLWQVFTRTVLGNPNTITEEFVRFSLIWFAMLSSAYVVGQKAHLAVTILSEKLSGKKNQLLEIVIQLLFLVFSIIIMVYGGWKAVGITMDQISPSLGISMGYVYLAIPVSGILIIIYSLINLVDTIKGNTIIKEKL